MKILITGGAGYIGSVLTRKLLMDKHEITVLDNFTYNQNSLIELCSFKNLNIVINDVRNENILNKLINSNDVIIPLAAIVGAPACDKNVDLATLVNEKQIKNIVEFSSSNQKIIFPVTNSGYGIGKKDIYCDEKSSLNPVSHYGKTKVNAEKILLDNGNVVALRLATVFGSSPRMRTDLLVNDFVLKAVRDKYIVLFESHFKRNFIHILDVVNAIIFSLENYSIMKGNTFNLGLSEANLSKLELCKTIKKFIQDFDIFNSEFSEDPDKRDYIISNNKIENIGWKSQYTLEEGILELIKLYSFLKINSLNNL